MVSLTAVLLAPAVALCMAASAEAPFCLARDGQPAATIVVAARPTAAARFAAAELQEHVRKMTGATLPIAADDAKVKGPRILVGESAATRALKVDSHFKPQEHLISFLPKTLVLMGSDAAGGESSAAGVPERVAGRFGSALKFDGAKTVFKVSDFAFDDAKGSMEAWVWIPAAEPAEKDGTILRLDGSDPWTYHIVQRNAKSSVISYTTYDGKEGRRVQSGPLAEGWHHLLATHDAAAAKMELFVDGVSVGAASYVKTTCKGTMLMVGGIATDDQSAAGNPFVGLIDEVRISKVVRPSPVGLPTAPAAADAETVALFHFDEKDGAPQDCSSARNDATPPGLYEERGTLDAVYDFLERFCDVRWYAPTEIGLVCPSAPTLMVRGRDVRRAPAMVYRWITATPLYLPTPAERVPARDVLLWKLRMRLGGQPTAVNHSFYGYYDRFLKEHADWFAQGYTGQPPQMCYSNPDFIRQVVADARDYFDGKGAKPGAAAMGDVFGLVPMDNGEYCKCPRCQAELNEAERNNPQFTSGLASDYVFGFVNKVASEVHKTHPDKWIGALGYWNYAYYPTRVRLEPNVMIQLCLHARNWWSPAMEANDRKVLDAWRNNDPERPLYLWLYYCFPSLNAKGGGYHYFPGFFAHTVVRQMKLYHEAHIRGIFLEHSGEFGATYLMDQLEFYVTFKLADDPTLDGNQLIDEFFARYYGAAAAPMKALYCAIEETYSSPSSYPEAIQKSPAHQHQNESLAWDALGTPARMAEFAKRMDEARAAAQTPVEKARVALFEKGIWDDMVAGRKQHDEKASPSK